MSAAPKSLPPVSRVAWAQAVRIIRSRFPPIDLFEDISDPADWDALARAETKTNPRFELSIGRLDLVPAERRVGGPGSSWVMAPFTHASPDRPSRFSDGAFGVYYAANSFEGALAETMHHHARFMAATIEPPGWTSDFRELIGKVEAEFHDLRASRAWAACLTPNDYSVSQALGGELRAGGSNGLVYPSVRQPGAECLGAFYPDVIGVPAQGRHLSYHWDGERIDKLKDVTSGVAYRVEASSTAPNDVAGQH